MQIREPWEDELREIRRRQRFDTAAGFFTLAGFFALLVGIVVLAVVRMT